MRKLDITKEKAPGGTGGKEPAWQCTGLAGWLGGKESACNAEGPGDAVGSTPGLGRSPGGGHGNPLQYSCL